MTKLLQTAFQQAGQLPIPQQDILAQWILDELASEQRWDQLFAQSGDMLAAWALEAMAEDDAGLTQPIDVLWDELQPERVLA